MVRVNVLSKSSKIAINSKINQELESFKQEVFLRFSSIEQRIKELEGEAQAQKKQRCDLENKISSIDPVLQESISFINQIEELRGAINRLDREVAGLQGDLTSNNRLNIEKIVNEVTEGRA